MMKRSHYNILTVTRSAIVLAVSSLLLCCIPEPPLHLFDGGDVTIQLPMVKLELDAYWDYETYGDISSWRDEWYYGWDETDQRIFGEIGYSEPTAFSLRRYFTGMEPLAPHTSVYSNTIEGHSFQGKYTWGFWDILVWNDIKTPDGVQSLNFDEKTSLDYVTAYTNPSMVPTRADRAYYQPEELFSAYEQGIEIDRNLSGFEYDPITGVYVKKLNLVLEPISYIYLTQVILHHNRGKIVGVDGIGRLSGFAQKTVVNTGVAADNDFITVYYDTRFKNNCDMEGEPVDIVGGRLLTFGIGGLNANRIKHRDDVKDKVPHYLDVTMQFNNGMDSTFVFDVSEKVRRRWKGGVITVELDMDTISIPSRSGGSAFDAVVKDFEEETHEFDL
ncbi:MAG: hypothetical protein J6Q22_19230 [Prevotella sp.]|nr:hypothetical protein [Prevotella sp.]